MINFALIKEFSMVTGLYRPAYAAYRLLNPAELARFRRELNFYSKLIEPGTLCFDVGANIGKRAEVFLKAGASVVAFEPQPDCMRELKARCGDYRGKLYTCQSVLGEKPGEAVLNLRQEWTGMATLLSEWQGTPKGTISVSMTTLDHAIAQYGKPDYCKIDVEGYEFNVLQGLTQAIPLISFETHVREREIEMTRMCLDHLSQFGELQINFMPSESMEFAFREWLNLKQFLNVFPDDFRDREGYFFGDIFARTFVR